MRVVLHVCPHHVAPAGPAHSLHHLYGHETTFGPDDDDAGPSTAFTAFLEDANGQRSTEKRVRVDEVYDNPASWPRLLDMEVKHLTQDLLQGVPPLLLTRT